MIYGSLCSGIEAATQAWHQLGWEPAFFSDVEAFPRRVLKTHYPHVPLYGDMTKFQEWPDHAIDLLVGGTPCQSFSVAGLRKGLADPRGNLMLTFGATAEKYEPRWIVWENVPGVLSSSGGRDFGTFLGMLGELGYGTAYRVLDAQHVRTHSHPGAVPQQRRRVYVVGCLGDWRRAAAVLFEPESLRGDIAAREGVAIQNRNVVGTLTTRTGRARDNYSAECGHCIVDGGRPRWLTPEECELLMGFPRGYTDIGNGQGKPTPDSPRYKALGNSMAVNVMTWIGERIEMVEQLCHEPEGEETT